MSQYHINLTDDEIEIADRAGRVAAVLMRHEEGSVSLTIFDLFHGMSDTAFVDRDILPMVADAFRILAGEKVG